MADLRSQLQDGLGGSYALEPVLRMPYYISPGWLRIDPAFDPLRHQPRFKRLGEGTA